MKIFQFHFKGKSSNNDQDKKKDLRYYFLSIIVEDSVGEVSTMVIN